MLTLDAYYKMAMLTSAYSERGVSALITVESRSLASIFLRILRPQALDSDSFTYIHIDACMQITANGQNRLQGPWTIAVG